MRIEREAGVVMGALVDGYLKASFDAVFDSHDDTCALDASRVFITSYRARFVWPVRVLGALNPLGALARWPRMRRTRRLIADPLALHRPRCQRAGGRW